MEKRVCHVTSVHSRYDVRIFQKECRSLAANGYEVYLVVNDEKEDEEIDKVHIVSSRVNYHSHLQRMIKVSKRVYWRALEINASIYHIHDPELLPYALKLLKKGKKVIFDSHEFYAQQILLKQYIPNPIRRLVSTIYEKYERYVLQRINGVIVPCLYNGEDYFKGNYKRQIFLDNVPLLSEIPQKLYDSPKKDKQVCYVGTISENRGIDILIQASAKARVNLALAGGISSPILKEKLTGFSKKGFLHYYGKVSHIESYKIISQSCIGMCLLQNKGQYSMLSNLPTKIYEYMALGVPIIASDFPYYKEILQKENCGICVNPRDINAISEAIEKLMRNPLKLKEMGENGRKLIEKKYSWEKEEEKLLKFYKEIIEENDKRKEKQN